MILMLINIHNLMRIVSNKLKIITKFLQIISKNYRKIKQFNKNLSTINYFYMVII